MLFASVSRVAKPCDGWAVAMLFTVGASRSVKMFGFDSLLKIGVGPPNHPF